MRFLHTSEAEIEPGVTVSEVVVIEAHEMQNGGVEVANMDGIHGGAETDLVGAAVDDAALHACSGCSICFA